MLVAYALVTLYAASSPLWQAHGTLGMIVDYQVRVRSVAPDGPAARAGVRAGDRVVLGSVSFQQRRYVAGVGARIAAGTSIDMRLERDGVAYPVHLVAVARALDAAEIVTLIFTLVASVLLIGVGVALIVLRPSAATWGFGLYCFTDFPAATSQFGLTSPLAALWAISAYDVIENLGTAGIVLFVLEFPRPFDCAWRRTVRRALPALFVLVGAMTLYPDYANLVLGIGASVENRILQGVFGAVYALALVILFDTYRRVLPVERERLRWVRVGFILGIVTNYIGATLIFSSIVSIEPPRPVLNVLVSLNALLPLTVAYAVVRHRVLDINFVLGRALVYALLTTLLAGCFELFDWFFGGYLEAFRLSRVLEAATAIGIALIFDALHERTKRAIDGLFFRRRRAAEARIADVIHALPGARSEAEVTACLVDEPASAFSLTSAALFHIDRDGAHMRRIASHGWSDDACAVLDQSDTLLRELRAGVHALRLDEFDWGRRDVPTSIRAPVLAIAMHARDDVIGILLYGGHPDGGDIDPGEVKQLEALAHAGSAAYARLDTDFLRDENAALRARLDESRRANTP